MLSEGYFVVVLREDLVAHWALLAVVTVHVGSHLFLRQISHDAIAHRAGLLRQRDDVTENTPDGAVVINVITIIQ